MALMSFPGHRTERVKQPHTFKILQNVGNFTKKRFNGKFPTKILGRISEWVANGNKT